MTWDLDQLQGLLSEQTDLVITRESDCLLIANEDGQTHGSQSAESKFVNLLFAQSEVNDTTALNAAILRTHMVFPLTTVGISNLNGEDYYTAFGALSAQSKESSILIEVETLFQNVEAFLDAYQEYLK